MKSSFAVAALVALVASPVLAADPADYFPPVDAGLPTDWSGLYAGIYGGYGLGTVASETNGVSGSVDGGGALLGATLGFSTQLDGYLVVGVEGDLGWANITGSDSCAVNDSYECSGTVNWLATLRARAGIAFDQMLYYATAGVAAAELTSSVDPTPNAATGSFTDSFVGWTAGLGAEMRLDGNMSIKAEYAYADLGSRTAPAGTLSTSLDTELSASIHTVKVGLNIGF